MFVGDADFERDCLRQGDILERVPFPLLDLSNLPVLGQIQGGKTEFQYPMLTTLLRQHRDDPHYFTGQLALRLSYCAVISHCCELEPRHGRLLPACFSVARLIPVKSSIIADATKLESLRENRDPRKGNPGFLDYFHVQAHPRLDSKEWMVDYGQLVSIPNSQFPDILGRKVLQMDNRSRMKFKIKLAAFLGRTTREEESAGLVDPWAETS